MTYVTTDNLMLIAGSLAPNFMALPQITNVRNAPHAIEVGGWLKHHKPYTITLRLNANKYGGVEATLAIRPFYAP